MSDAYTGGCACGAIRYEIPGEPVFMNHCQSLDCQHQSGTGHGSYLTFAGDGVTLTGESVPEQRPKQTREMPTTSRTFD